MSPLRDALNGFVHDWYTFPGNPGAVQNELIEALEAKLAELKAERGDKPLMRHPMQVIEWDGEGVIRFRQNKIIRYLIDLGTSKGWFDMNSLAIVPFDDDDRMQFAMQIGYSVSGAGDLSYFKEEVIAAADKIAQELPFR